MKRETYFFRVREEQIDLTFMLWLSIHLFIQCINKINILCDTTQIIMKSSQNSIILNWIIENTTTRNGKLRWNRYFVTDHHHFAVVVNWRTQFWPNNSMICMCVKFTVFIPLTTNIKHAIRFFPLKICVFYSF